MMSRLLKSSALTLMISFLMSFLFNGNLLLVMGTTLIVALPLFLGFKTSRKLPTSICSVKDTAAFPASDPIDQGKSCIQQISSQQEGKQMIYKVVPFNASVSFGEGGQVVANKLSEFIATNAVDGWEFVGTSQFSSTAAGSKGCFGFGAEPERDFTTIVAIFRK